ncbi:thiamine-binding protein [Metabacillus arenae]|uniref:Thiamine-binding protein n=1 Tax=Metabacillus arenae TaxID=2771434 RepID=A0A926NFX7_9BACI|nr:MTH1187 family thiamine-binding protein [Metabacillus arenae]MBD1379783.1 thiamine-binding protein [Metabacillus arenae]
MATVTAGIQVLPNGQDVDTYGVIPRIIDSVKDSGLKYKIGPMETVVEGELDEILHLVKELQLVGINLGASEVMSNIKLHYKPDGVTIEDKLTHV